MLREIFGSVLCLFVCALFATPAFAHDMAIGSTESPEGFGNPLVSQNYQHQDANDWKGWAYFTVKNNGSEDWTDFHFEILEVGAYTPAESVLIMDESGFEPSTSQTCTSIVVTSSTSAMDTLDYYFPDDPITPGDIATFTFYTDNTANNLGYFGLTAYPTPEPGTLLILTLGGTAILAFRRKRHSMA